jgi:hypothetical protein
MNDDLRNRLLGADSRDAGCDSGFDVVDEYVEAVLRGEDVAKLFPQVVAHLAGCNACREDVEGIIAAVRLRTAPPDEPR